MTLPETGNALTDDEKALLSQAILKGFRDKPPTIAVIGLSGTGKSSTLNALFGQKLPVSHSIRGTSDFTRIELTAVPKDKSLGLLPFVFMDAPGLGEDIGKDSGYLSQYDVNLPDCDVILWVVSARNRALALDQSYLERFRVFADKIVLGINQVDLLAPNNWDSRLNHLSSEQEAVLEEVKSDRCDRLSRVLGKSIPTVAYSAEKRWRLVELLNVVLGACSTERQFFFNLLSHVKPDDFLPKQLSSLDKAKIELALDSLKTRDRSQQRLFRNFFDPRSWRDE